MDKELYAAALKARENAYAPYSKFKVGAAVKTKSGKIYSGCNVENGSYGLTCCAERCAIFNAVSAGEYDFTAICITADTTLPVSPCGACRQVMQEFKIPQIILTNVHGDIKEFTLQELLPYEFTL